MGKDFEITELRAFAATVRGGSLTRAAGALGLSQPTVTQRIQRLERAVGERLLVRDARGIRLTQAGEALLVYADRILALHDEARTSLEGFSDLRSGRRTVGLLEDLAVATLPTALADFAAIHPAVDLEVVLGSGQALRRLADRGRLDLTFGDTAAMSDATVRWRRQTELVWCAASHLRTLPDPLPLVLFSQPCLWRQPVLDTLNQHGVRWRIAFQSTSLHAVQAAVCAGIGVGPLLAGTLPGDVARRTDLPAPPPVEIGISRRPDTHTDAALDSLERLLRRAAEESTLDQALTSDSP